MLFMDFGNGPVPIVPTNAHQFGLLQARRVLSQGVQAVSVRDERTGTVYFEASRVSDHSFAWRTSQMAASAFDTLES